ncbi:putative inorganic phosphate cotransporter [Euwallacea fornicatus]|uniref:putative inorganic phosphate cotransporter n=1 Tax=Euwallacea fornicatus TaxID=995702 RepID=UPI00338F40D2
MVQSESLKKDILYSAVDDKLIEHVPKIGKRHLQCLVLFLITFIAYGFRVNLSVAIVAMTDPTANENSDIQTYPHWTHKGAILSAFFWGYIWPQVFAGYAANRFGAKWFLVGTMSLQSIVGFCTPHIAAHLGEIGVMLGRAVQGFCQGFLFPSLTHLLSQWVPHEERARMTGFVYGAVPFGTLCAMLVSGAIAGSSHGWPMIFYMYGSLGILVSVLFAIVGYNSPAVDPTISEAEKQYIERSLGHTDEKPSHKVPWKGILTSKPVWSLLVTQCGFVYGFWILLTQIPTYMKFVLNFNIKDNSLLSSLPYLVLFILSFPLSFLSDFIINKKYVSQTTSRKLFSSVGIVTTSIALFMMGYVKPDESTKAIWLLIAAISLSAFCNFGWPLNHMDLSPNHAGTLMGLCNGISNIFSGIAPLTVQLLVKDERDPVQWRIIFFLAAGVQIVSGMIFNVYGSAEVQPWNEDDRKKEDKE